MAVISNSIEQMLANPALIPTLPRGSEARCHGLALESTKRGVNERVQDLYQANKAAGSILAARAGMLLQTCSAASFRTAETSGCKEQEKVLKLTNRLQFTNSEKAFIQCHEIGGQKYIFVADCHQDEKFLKLWADVSLCGVKREFAIFREIGCRDPQSEKDYCRFLCGLDISGMPSPWIFGLEGPAFPLQLCVMCLLLYKTPTKNPQRLMSFLDDLRINRPWDQVVHRAHAIKPFSQAAAPLFAEIQENLRLMETAEAFKQKRQNLYDALLKKHSDVAWKDLFFALAKTSLLDVPAIQKAFSSSQIEFILRLLLKPNAEDRGRFLEEIQTQMRDNAMAHALFSTELPKGVVRLAQVGYLHLPGIIRELERLAALQQKPHEGKKA